MNTNVKQFHQMRETLSSQYCCRQEQTTIRTEQKTCLDGGFDDVDIFTWQSGSSKRQIIVAFMLHLAFLQLKKCNKTLILESEEIYNDASKL